MHSFVIIIECKMYFLQNNIIANLKIIRYNWKITLQTLYAIPSQIWVDESFTWDYEESGVDYIFLEAAKVWTPDFGIYNR